MFEVLLYIKRQLVFIDRIDRIKIFVLFKLSYRFSVIINKIYDIKKNYNSKANLSKRKNVGCFLCYDFKIFYYVLIFKIV